MFRSHIRDCDAQIAQEKLGDGLKSYIKCEEVSELYEYHHRWASTLEKQIGLYREAQMRPQQREAQGRLDTVRRLEQQGASR